jgi:hypothetical protein
VPHGVAVGSGAAQARVGESAPDLSAAPSLAPGSPAGAWIACWRLDRLLAPGSPAGAWIACWRRDRLLAPGFRCLGLDERLGLLSSLARRDLGGVRGATGNYVSMNCAPTSNAHRPRTKLPNVRADRPSVESSQNCLPVPLDAKRQDIVGAIENQ